MAKEMFFDVNFPFFICEMNKKERRGKKRENEDSFSFLEGRRRKANKFE